MNQDPEVKSSEISGLASDLNAFEARMLGRAHDLEGEFDDAATEFTEIIKWDISTLNAEDLATWMDVTSSIRFCAAITEEWSDYVKEYKQERLRIINRWNEEAPGLAKGLDEAPPSFSFIWEASPAEEAEAALAALKAELQGQEKTAFQTLDTRGSELSGDLSNGPTPESVQRLISEGYITWSYFNLGGDVEAMPIDADPEEMVDELIEYIDDPEGYEGDISEIIVLLNNMGIVAMDKQENGGTLSSAEIEFLTTFYDSLEEAGNRHPMPSGVLTIANLIAQQEGIGDDVSEQLLGALGNGILVLSDESLIGNYDHLPQSIKDIVEGFGNNDEVVDREWMEEAIVLSDMMGSSIPGLQGGEHFSVNLTQTIAHVLDVVNPESDMSLTSEQFEILLDVSTRNEDANHAILTGDGPYGHPVHGLDTEMTLRGLYTHDWPDDSTAIAGLTDWIWQQASGEQHEKIQAAEAAVGLIETLAEKEGENFLNTGITVEDNPNAAITELNPSLAESLSRIFFTHIDSFGISWTGDHNEGSMVGDRAEHLPLFEGEDVALFLDEGSRQNYLQLLMANDEVAPNVLLAVVEHEQKTLAASIFDGSYSPGEYSNESGRLHGLVDGAMLSEIDSRAEEAGISFEEAKKQAQAKWETAYKVMAELTSGSLGSIPGPAGDVLGTGAGVVGALFEEPMKDYISDKVEEEMQDYEERFDRGESIASRLTGGEDEARWHIELQLAHVLIREGVIDLEDLERTGALVDDADGSPMLPASPDEWESGHVGKRKNIRDVIEDIPSSGLSSNEVNELIDEYVQYYLDSFNPAPR
jgi:hypothetical protein